MEGYAGEGPKWRLEHAVNGSSICNQAACKRAKSQIAKGELRIGTHTLFDGNGEHRWYMAWRHWGCGTKQQIKGLKEVTGDDATKAPGYDRLSPEAQEQVRLAFENGSVVDKEFKGVREDLAKLVKHYGGEITDATDYKVDIAARGTAGCRSSDCPDNGVKIAKGELRLGFYVPYDGDHGSWRYKHWKCISDFDIEKITQLYHHDSLDGAPGLPEPFDQVVEKTIETQKVVEPPKPEVKPAKKGGARKRGKKQVLEEEESEDEVAEPLQDQIEIVRKGSETKGDQAEAAQEEGADANTKPKRKAAAKKNKKRTVEDEDEESEPEYVPRKSKRRAAGLQKNE